MPKKVTDPSLDAYTQGLAALQKKQWAQAVELFTKSINAADRAEVKDRARQLLAAAQQHLGAANPADTPKPKKSDEDPFLLAVFEKNRGNLAAALELCKRGGREHKDERFAYLAASVHALEGRLDEAVEVLGRAIEMNATNRVHAFHDPDFAELRRNRDYHRTLFELS
jgi:tetratricopeptide (TPR) repeat protein